LYVYRKLRGPNIISNYGVKIGIDKHISNNILQFLYNGSYEGQEINILLNKLSKKDIVLDIGAGLGFLTCWCAKKIGSEKVYAVEANPHMIQPIMNNFSLNHVHPTLWNIAISDKKKLSLYIENEFWSSSIIKRSENPQCVEVETKSGNEIIKVTKANFLLVDIEGGEENLLPELNLDSINKLLIEIHPHVIGKKGASSVIKCILDKGLSLDTRYAFGDVLFFER
jgi:FkbM family methyltransferase